jgi:hypothetical protein
VESLREWFRASTARRPWPRGGGAGRCRPAAGNQVTVEAPVPAGRVGLAEFAPLVGAVAAVQDDATWPRSSPGSGTGWRWPAHRSTSPAACLRPMFARVRFVAPGAWALATRAGRRSGRWTCPAGPLGRHARVGDPVQPRAAVEPGVKYELVFRPAGRRRGRRGPRRADHLPARRERHRSGPEGRARPAHHRGRAEGRDGGPPGRDGHPPPAGPVRAGEPRAEGGGEGGSRRPELVGRAHLESADPPGRLPTPGSLGPGRLHTGAERGPVAVHPARCALRRARCVPHGPHRLGPTVARPVRPWGCRRGSDEVGGRGSNRAVGSRWGRRPGSGRSGTTPSPATGTSWASFGTVCGVPAEPGGPSVRVAGRRQPRALGRAVCGLHPDPPAAQPSRFASG